MAQTKAWLAPYSWEFVTAQNLILCGQKGALHKPTSDGHDTTRAVWQANHQKEMTLDEAVDLCRSCHRMAPFCFYNGNTFAGIIRDVVFNLALPPEQASIVRSLAGHIVAGVATAEEVEAFRRFSDQLA
ncbi:MAG: hypothetical protein JNM99_24040 [Verrucomicrobiaceae bacterium]|nr:hypothetical protein [Verrucomicrobiaceae bacterium]